jgi:hypothetical protein
VNYTLIKQKVIQCEKKSSKKYLRHMRFSQMLKSALNTMKRDHFLNAVVLEHHRVDKTFRAVTSMIYLAEEILKIFLQIFLAEAGGVALPWLGPDECAAGAFQRKKSSDGDLENFLLLLVSFEANPDAGFLHATVGLVASSVVVYVAAVRLPEVNVTV